MHDFNLGTCCACGQPGTPDNPVQTILGLEQKSPTPGMGWGCVQCGLSMDGATAVVCDRCLESNAPLQWACVDYPDGDRIPLHQLQGHHQHDLSKHPEYDPNPDTAPDTTLSTWFWGGVDDEF